MKESISIAELARLLGVDPGSFFDFIEKGQLGHLVSQQRILYSNLPILLDAYRNTYNLQNTSWPIPEWLLSDSSKWARALVEAYRAPVAFPASLSPSQGRILHELVLECRPATAVEIGCFIGVSSIWIGSALSKAGSGRLYSVDVFERKFPVPPYHWNFLGDPLQFAEEEIRNAGLDNYVQFFRMESRLFGKRLRQYTDEKIDFLFIDGDHSIGGCLDDFITFFPHVREGGHILLHDIYPKECGWTGPRYLLDRVINDNACLEVREIETEPNFGMALVTKVKDTKAFYPWHNPRLEAIRRLHRAKGLLRNAMSFD